jgi:hypothetical protein
MLDEEKRLRTCRASEPGPHVHGLMSLICN